MGKKKTKKQSKASVTPSKKNQLDVNLDKTTARWGDRSSCSDHTIDTIIEYDKLQDYLEN